MAEIISGVISSLITSFGFYLFRRLEMKEVKESSTSNVTTNGIGRKLTKMSPITIKMNHINFPRCYFELVVFPSMTTKQLSKAVATVC